MHLGVVMQFVLITIDWSFHGYLGRGCDSAKVILRQKVIMALSNIVP